ncbi:HutD family protein [Sedimentitalea sp.]|uniref:HutD/Ves family protein n=1 Tax=Sedimentitalea sp. TaxID=2048915 RepID=UPI003298BD0F
MQILKQRDLVDVPWKNGGGITRNIARGMRADQAVWTISRADVAQDGPFSDFAGMMRVLTVVSGGPMILETPTATIDAALWQPARFDGGIKVNSRLTGGPLTDLNLMFDLAHCDGNVLVRQGTLKDEVARPKHGLLALHILSGEPLIDETRLTTGDTAFVDQDCAAVQLRPDDALLEIRLAYRSQSEAIKLCIADR